MGRRVDRSSPLVDGRLPAGYRLNAVIDPVAVAGPYLTIRKFPERPFTIDDLVSRGTLTGQAAVFLGACVRARKNVLVAGGTGSGKTTLLNILASFIGPRERVVTIEDAAELRLQQEHVVTLETRPPNLEGAGEIGIRDLVRNALRMRPDRIIVGECRGAEAVDMLQAMNTGHAGSMTTLHANTAAEAVRRLEVMVLSALAIPLVAAREQIAGALDLVVHIGRLPSGARRVLQVSEVVGTDPDTSDVQLTDIFRLQDEQGGLVLTGRLPSFAHELVQLGLLEPGAFLGAVGGGP
jgi:pilus assembly protein CpaF